MIVSFDGKRAVNNMTGLGNYSRRVIGALAKKYPSDNYVVLAPRMKSSVELNELLLMDNVELDVAPHPKLGHLWRSGKGIIKSAKSRSAEVFHGLSAELPFGIGRSGMASIVTIHDFIYHHFPQHYSFIDRNIYYRKALHACKVADTIVTVSNYTKQDVVNILGINPDKIKVVYPCVGENYLNQPTSSEIVEMKKQLGLPARYILAVGRLVYHKNLILAIESLSILNDKNISLVIVGQENSYWRNTLYPTIVKYNLTDRVLLVPRVDSRWMPALYAGTQAVVFPSFCEGFGLPILEANHCKTPVLCATGSALDEVGGEAVSFFNPNDARDLAQSLDRVLEDVQLSNILKEKGQINAQRFTPMKMAEDLHNIYENALSSKQ